VRLALLPEKIPTPNICVRHQILQIRCRHQKFESSLHQIFVVRVTGGVDKHQIRVHQTPNRFVITEKIGVRCLRQHGRRCSKSISTGADDFSSKLNFRFGNDKTFSNGPFPKSKVWIWTKILSKVAHFGQISCPNYTLGELLDELVSRKTSPFALISDRVGTPSSLPVRRPLHP
jgi:hypothetical protein